MPSYPLRESLERMKFIAEQIFKLLGLHSTILMKSFGGSRITQTILSFTGDDKQAMEAGLKKHLAEDVKQNGLTEVVLIGEANFAAGENAMTWLKLFGDLDNFPSKTDILALTYASDKEFFTLIASLDKTQRRLGEWMLLDEAETINPLRDVFRAS